MEVIVAKGTGDWLGENRSLTDDEISQFLSGPIVARIATTRKSGAPYVAPVWQYYDGKNMWIIPRERSIFVKHIQRDPRVAVSCALDSTPWTRVLFLGRVEIVEGPKPPSGKMAEIGRKMSAKYMGEHGSDYSDLTQERPRYLVKIIPEKTISWTGSEWAEKYRK